MKTKNMKYNWWINATDLDKTPYNTEAEAMAAAEKYCKFHMLDPRTIKIESYEE